MAGNGHIAPKARTEDLIVKDLADEVLVYDLDRHQAHCLNRAAALVWRHCDGRRSADDVAQIVGRELGTPVDEDMVWLALDQLKKFNLLEESATLPFGMSRMNRRDFIRKAGIAAALTVPVVSSIVSPKSAAAASCLLTGAACNSGVECCSGVCAAGFCT